MPNFFKRHLVSSGIRTMFSSSLSSRTITKKIKKFQITNEIQPKGTLIKIFLCDKLQSEQQHHQIVGAEEVRYAQQWVHKNIIQNNPNCLLIWTTPSIRSTSKQDEVIDCGHTFSSVTNEEGKTVCFLSKRPNTKAILGERQRIPDARFSKPLQKTKVYKPLFNSVEEEIEKWFKRTTSISKRPLYAHIIPFTALKWDRTVYEKNVRYIKEMQDPFVLYSTIHPSGDYFIRANNCNSNTAQALFGLASPSVQDMSCQEATITIVSSLLYDKTDYLLQAQSIGLNQGIESPSVPDEMYTPSFTG